MSYGLPKVNRYLIYRVPTASQVLLHMLGTYGVRHNNVPASIQKSTFQFWPARPNPALSVCVLAWSLNVTIDNRRSALGLPVKTLLVSECTVLLSQAICILR